jgi:hypothetical protein
MENADFKIELIQKIIECDDLEILMQISEILNPEIAVLQVNEPTEVYEKTEKLYVLNDWQKERIKIARQQIENGEFLTEEEADIEMQKWFEEEEKLYGR